jgi:hypothetical protein
MEHKPGASSPVARIPRPILLDLCRISVHIDASETLSLFGENTRTALRPIASDRDSKRKVQQDGDTGSMMRCEQKCVDRTRMAMGIIRVQWVADIGGSRPNSYNQAVVVDANR